MKRYIKDLIVISILSFLLHGGYILLTGEVAESWSLIWWSITFTSIGLSYAVDKYILKWKD